MKELIKLLIAVLTSSMFAMTVQAKDFQVKGIVVDSLTNEGEPFVTWRIFEQGEMKSPIKVGTSDENGAFSEELPHVGEYLIAFSAVGRNQTERKFSVSTDNHIVNLGQIILSDANETLDEVVVSARRPIISSENDKLIYNMEEDPAAKSSTVIEMLRKVPMVTVDGEDNIKLNGSTSFKIYVNGKPDPMLSQNPQQILKVMPASSIKKIEVITEPGAKYDAEGSGGILNIVTESKSTTDGAMANFSGALSNRDANTTVYARAKKGNFAVGATYTIGKQFDRTSPNKGLRENFLSDSEKYYQNLLTVTQRATINLGNLQVSFEPDTLNLFTLSGNVVLVDASGDITGEFSMSATDMTPTWSYREGSKAIIDVRTMNVAASYQHNFRRQGHNLILSYLFNHGNNRQNFSNRYFDFKGIPTIPDERNDVETPSDEHTLQIDYTNPFSPGHLAEFGAKFILRRNDNNSSYYTATDEDFIFDNTKSIKMQQFQDVAAAYASYTLNYRKLTFKGGLRYEYTHMGADFRTAGYENFSSTLHDIVPNVMMGWKLNDASNIRLSYQMRISRPNIENLNPFHNTSIPGEVTYGNPDLSSSTNNDIILTYSDFGHSIGYNLSLKYSRSDNLVSEYSYIDNSVLYTTYDNIGNQQETSLSGYAAWSITPKMRLSINGTVRYSNFNFSKMEIRNFGWSGNFGGDFSYEMPWKLRLNAYGGYGSKQTSLQGFSTSWYYYGLSVTRKFLKDNRLEIGINTNQFLTPDQTYTVTKETDTFRSVTRFTNPQWKVGISINYTLGGLNQDVKKAAKSIVNDDIQTGSSGNIL